MSYSTIEDAIAEVRKKRDELGGKIELLKTERDELLHAPLCKSDILASINAGIDADAEHLPRLIRTAIENIASRPGKTDPFKVWNYIERGEAVTMLLADLLKERFAAAIGALPESDAAGPPLAKRTKRISAIDKELDGLETELTELRNRARRNGINLRGTAV